MVVRNARQIAGNLRKQSLQSPAKTLLRKVKNMKRSAGSRHDTRIPISIIVASRMLAF